MLPSKVQFVLTCLIILKSDILAFALNDTNNYDLCSPLENKLGSCMPVNECKSIVSILSSRRPLSKDIINILRQLQCGFEGHIPKICCPLEEINYSKLTDSSTVIKTSSKTPLLPDLDHCGLFVTSRLFSASRAELGDYPWNALLGYNTGNGTKFYCGGALISKRYVLTAAHCASRVDNYELSSVRLGEYRTTTNPDCEDLGYNELICTDGILDIPIEKTILHEEYNPNDPNRYFDIALIRLAQDVTFTDFLSPVCLPPLSKLAKDEKFGERPLSISGWGIATDRQKGTFKHHISLQLKHVNECKASLRYKNKNLQLKGDQLCGKSRPAENPCYADDGAVLVSMVHAYSPYGNHFALGVSTFDIDQCSEDPDYIIFAKLKDYVPWIYNNLE